MLRHLHSQMSNHVNKKKSGIKQCCGTHNIYRCPIIFTNKYGSKAMLRHITFTGVLSLTELEIKDVAIHYIHECLIISPNES